MKPGVLHNFHDDGRLHSVLDTLAVRVLADTLSAAQDVPAPRYIEGAETDFSEATPGATTGGADGDAPQDISHQGPWPAETETTITDPATAL